MKKYISMLLIISILESLFIYSVKATEEPIGYFDTEQKAIPENLITNGWAIDGLSSSYVTRAHPDNTYEQYIVNTVDPSNNVYTFHGSFVAAKANISTSPSAQYVNLQGYEAGKTYVYQALVKNMNADYTPYYGIAHPNNKGGHSNNIGSNTYGKTGMAVTSTEWMLFRDTITYPNSYDSTVTDYNGQVIYQGVRVNNTEAGASVAVMKNSVNINVKNSLDDDSLYLAEEIAYDINLYPESELEYGEELKLVQNGNLSLNAEVVNQIKIPGTLDQTVKWAVVTEDRLTQVENITMQTEGNLLILSCDETLIEGRYAAVAISEKYNIVKGIEFDVVKDLSDTYKDFTPQESTGNLIQKPQNSGFATSSSDNVKLTTQDGYITIEALDDIENELGVEGLRVRNVGTNGFSSAFNFEAGKTYAIKAKVRNPQPETDVYFNASISNSTIDTLSFTTEYGSKGMLLTKDWQVFTASIRVSENYDYDAEIKNRSFTMGLISGSVKGAKADVELSVYVEEEKIGDFSNEIVSGDNILTENKSLTFKAELTNQFGIKGSLSDDLKWVALTADRVTEAPGFSFVTNNDGTVTASVTENTPVGNFVIAAYSKKYNAAKGVGVTVKHEKYKVYVSTDGNDRACGSYSEPLKSLAGAKAFVRERIAEGVFDYYTGIDVIFSQGEYAVENEAHFAKADSGTELNPVTYKANGKVVFKGSMDLDLDKAEKVTEESVLNRLNESVRDKVIELDISDYPHDLTKITLVATNKTVVNGGVEYPEIYLNGNEQNLAQWPNGDGEFSKYEYVASNQFKYADDAPSKWVNAENWWIGGFPYRDYDYRRMPGLSVDAENKVITVKTDSNTSTIFLDAANKSKRWKAYNLLEELDEVGEWYIDAEAKKLYYYPPKLCGDERLEISYLTNTMISMSGTEYVSFEGFEFAKTRGDAISTSDIKNVTIRNCKFTDCGGSAFYNTGAKSAQTDRDYWQRQKINGAYDCVIENCVFNNIGAYAVYISGGNVDTLTPGNNVIRNNFFYKCSQKVRGYPAIVLAGCGNTLEKNNISNLPFQAVNTCGNDHIIRYNEIYDVCRETEDCAAIYQGRNTVQRGTVVEYNYLHDLYPLYTFTADRYINAAIYWDDSQTGMTVKNNIIRNAKLGIFNNNGIDNNYSENTIIDTYMAMRIDVKGAAQNTDSTSGITGFAGYIENPELYYEKYDNLKTIIETDPINSGTTGKELGRFNVIKDNLFVNTQKEVMISEYCGTVENETVSECGDFVNPEAQDYRIKLNSDTYNKNSKLLNENFDIELIGANEDNLEFENDFELYYPFGRISSSETIHFMWSEALGATYYRLEISKKSDFSEIIYSDKLTFNYADVSGIEASSDKYYWRVSAINSSRNMPEEWMSETGEFYCGNIYVDNVTINQKENGVEIKADITNEIYMDIPLSQLYVAGYSTGGRLINVYKYDVEFTSMGYEFTETIPDNDEISYICLFLWDGMTPLCETVDKNYITQ